MACTACPFALTDQSEYVQNLGCLPDTHDLIKETRAGYVWGCHETDKPCAGQAEWFKGPEYPKGGPVLMYGTWFNHGMEQAKKEADEQAKVSTG